jgi:hypothetical protein
MALSNYFYHSQDPTWVVSSACWFSYLRTASTRMSSAMLQLIYSPEPWVTNHNPCQLEYVDSKLTLKHLLFPTLSDSGIMKKRDFDRIVKTCRSLFRMSPELKTQSYEGHLHHLDPVDGLRLSTSQMMIRGGGAILIPGGDLLRMANNIIKLR